MARLIPDELDDLDALTSGHRAERQTLLRLRAELPDDLSVYHAVHWAHADRSGSVYGEIDFIIANRHGKLLAIEQKSAAVYVADNDLKVDYGQNVGKSVRVQLARNLNSLRAEFSRRYPGKQLSVDHLLYLPNSSILGQTPSSLDPTRIVDVSRVGELCQIILALFDGASTSVAKNAAEAIHVHDFLSQKVEAVPHIGLLGRSAQEFTTRVSGGLATWAGRFTLTPYRLKVQGTAGSGKTQLALQELRRADRDGKLSLYICFNRALAEALKPSAPRSATVVTLHELARELGAQQGIDFDFTKPDVYEQMIAVLREYSASVSGLFDSLVIDEGQDLAASWVEALLPLANPGGRITLLEDPEQVLYDRDRFMAQNWPLLESPVNFRSPRTLVEFMNHFRLTEKPIIAGSGIRGFEPQWLVYDDKKSLLDQTEAALKQLLVEGYAAQSIVILTFSGVANSTFFATDAPRGLCNLPLMRQDGYNTDGQLRYTEGKVLVETLFRFKGQAADAVILTEMDFEQLDSRAKRRLFVALSRARLHAVLVSTRRVYEALHRFADQGEGLGTGKAELPGMTDA
jgi:hypothetical protein